MIDISQFKFNIVLKMMLLFASFVMSKRPIVLISCCMFTSNIYNQTGHMLTCWV